MRRLRDELLAALQAALPVDVVAYSLHGAMIAEGYDDCEGDLLARTRALVGPDVAVGALLDLHCHLSAAMIENADVIVTFKEYPHIDFVERGEELVELLARTARREIRPHMAVHDCRMIDLFHTTQEPMRGFVADMQAREGHDGVLSLSAAHGFPWGDAADMGTKMLVVTDGKPELGARLAAEFGERLFAMRGRAQKQPLSIADALDHAGRANGAPVVIADTADNAGGGAPSDSTFVLQAALERGLQDVAIGPLWDPIAAGAAMDAGEGATLDLRIGGKMGPTSGQPLDLRVKVGRTCRNAMQSYGPSHEPLGDCVGVSVNGVAIVLNTLRTQAFGPELFTNVGHRSALLPDRRGQVDPALPRRLRPARRRGALYRRPRHARTRPRAPAVPQGSAGRNGRSIRCRGAPVWAASAAYMRLFTACARTGSRRRRGRPGGCCRSRAPARH